MSCKVEELFRGQCHFLATHLVRKSIDFRSPSLRRNALEQDSGPASGLIDGGGEEEGQKGARNDEGDGVVKVQGIQSLGEAAEAVVEQETGKVDVRATG